jgi:hypothetical protein
MGLTAVQRLLRDHHNIHHEPIFEGVLCDEHITETGELQRHTFLTGRGSILPTLPEFFTGWMCQVEGCRRSLVFTGRYGHSKYGHPTMACEFVEINNDVPVCPDSPSDDREPLYLQLRSRCIFSFKVKKFDGLVQNAMQRFHTNPTKT